MWRMCVLPWIDVEAPIVRDGDEPIVRGMDGDKHRITVVHDPGPGLFV
jgi:hypothetical protein